jgi:threonine dehydratase
MLAQGGVLQSDPVVQGPGQLVSAATTPEPARHVLCASAGNFGQAVSYGFCQADRQVTVYVPRSANPAKIERIRQLGARVVEHGQDFDEAKLAARQAAEHMEEALFVEDGHDAAITIGAGSIGLELAPEHFDAIVVPVGNGALISGLACAVKDACPSTRILGVTPSTAPSMALSWRAGRPIPTDTADTCADGVAVRQPVARAVAWMRRWVDDVTTVDEEQIAAAVYQLFDLTGLLVEPAAAVPLAMARHSHFSDAGRICLILTGSNIDPRIREGLAFPATRRP